jgi:pyruvate dehydrogenase E2 component (dihydrolipoamide acetyltransferase)
MTEIVMPRLSDTMEEGTILRWLKRDGDFVRRGEELVEIETDKAAMVYESDGEGPLRIIAAEGDTLAVGATIAHVGETSGGVETPGAVQMPSAVQMAGGEPPAAADAAPPPAGAALHGDEDRVKASPLARRVARESGVDLHALTGTGPGGRIVRADVEAADAPHTDATVHDEARVTGSDGPDEDRVAQAPAPIPDEAGTAEMPAPAPVATPAPAEEQPTLAERVAAAKGETTVVELSRTQQTIARRMAESKATIPDFTLTVEVDMERCVALRSELKRLSPDQAPTYNDMIVKACALALREHPRANGSWRDGRIELHSRVNVGVAVAADDSLVVPTVFDADLKSLGEIARETRALAERVRSGTIAPPELGGGTFTVSNLGMYGVRSFTAIVNPPQAAILSVGALEQRPVVRDGGLFARNTVALVLACDHRILYGASAALFLARVRELLQEPAALAL